MVKVEEITIDGTLFTKTYSDDDRYVVREGVEYEEAWDPAVYGRTYTEGRKIERDEEEQGDAEEIVNILLGGA